MFVCEYFAPAWNAGGTVLSGWNLTRALARAGADVRVVTTDAHIWPRGSVPRERTDAGVRVTSARILRPLGRTAHRLGIAPGLPHELVRATRDVDVCVMQGFWTVPVGLASRISAWRRIPYVVSARGTLEDQSLTEKAWKKRLYLRLIASSTLRNAALVHFTSDLEMHRSRRALGRTKGVVVPNAFEARPLAPRDGDALRARLRMPAASRLVGMSGRIHPKKGFDVIVPALARSAEPVHLVIIGPDHEGYLRKVFELAETFGVRERVHAIGHQEPDALDWTYASIDLLALPSHRENFGNVVIEAIGQGTPVMISQEVPLGPYVKEHGFGVVVDTLDPMRWASSLDRWFASPHEIDREGASRQVARDFDLDRSGRRWMEILSEVASARGTRGA